MDKGERGCPGPTRGCNYKQTKKSMAGCQIRQ